MAIWKFQLFIIQTEDLMIVILIFLKVSDVGTVNLNPAVRKALDICDGKTGVECCCEQSSWLGWHLHHCMIFVSIFQYLFHLKVIIFLFPPQVNPSIM